MNTNVPSLGKLRKTLGEPAVEAYLKLWLLDLNKILDLKHPLKTYQIDTVAMAVVEKYRSLNIADINLIFKRAKFGEYGDFYDRITVPAIMKWFKLYFDDRCNAGAAASQQNHLRNKQSISVDRSSVKSTKSYFKYIEEKHTLDQTKKRIDNLKKSMK